MKHLEKLYRGHWKGLFAPYARIFFLSRSGQQEPSYNGLKGTKERKIFSLTIFFSETIEPRKTVLGSLERALRALHGPSYNGFKKNWAGVIGKGSSRPTGPYFFCQDLTNRSRVITHLEKPDRGHWKVLIAPYTPMFFLSRSDQQEPSYNEKRDRGHWKVLFAPYTPIFSLIRSDQQEPSYNGLKGTKERKIFSLTIFFSEIIAPKKTVPGTLEKTIAPRKTGLGHLKGMFAPYTPIFFWSRSDQYYKGLKATKERKIFFLTIFFSGTIAPRKTGPGPLESAHRALYAHHPGEPDRGRLKGLSAPYTPIFFCQNLTNRSRVKTHPEKPDRHLEKLDRGHWKGLFAPYTPIFFLSRSGQQEPSYNGLKGTKERKIFSLTIFSSETIEPRKTVLGSLERALRALHAHIFQAEEPDRGRLKGLSAPYTPIFFCQNLTNRSRVKSHPEKPDRKNWTGVNGKGSSRPTRPYFFCQDLSNRSRVITKKRTGVIGKGSSRPTRPYFFYQDLTNRSRVITHLEKLYWGHWKGLFASYMSIFFLLRSDQQEPSYNGLNGTKERKIFSITIFFAETIVPRKTGPESLENLTNRSRVITYPSYKGLKATKERKIFFLTIFFSGTIAPRKTGPGSLESAHRALYAHHPGEPDRGRLKGLSAPYTPIFFCQNLTNRSRVKTHPEKPDRKNWTGVIGKGSSRPTRPYFFCQDLTNRSRVITKKRTGVIGKGSSRPTRPYFFYQDLTNRSRVITHLEKLYWGHWKGLFASYISIFFLLRSDQQEPSYNGLNGTKERKIFSITIFFAETIEPSYNGLKGTKERKIFSLTIFISETIAPRKTGLGHLKGLFAPYTPIFFWSRSDQ
ncbi:LOW QUALITY PROTEIN: hypothetical protein V1477_000087 [Vespula maculifrons]|uniref:Maturase K n=1 Tax=Vespula maculifrons TaxID=7453 RepID=A0ABD2D2L9_VESMC